VIASLTKTPTILWSLGILGERVFFVVPNGGGFIAHMMATKTHAQRAGSVQL